MTAQEIYNKALAITGYASSELVDLTEVNSQALNFVNIAYADLFYIKNSDNFTEAEKLSDSIELEEILIQDCIAFYIAAMISNMVGCDEDYSFYLKIYEKKKKRFENRSVIGEIADALPKEWD